MSKNRIKQAMALLLALVLVLGGTAFDPTMAVASSGKNIKAGDSYYTILPTKSRTAEYVKPAKKTCTSASIPNTVKISGKTYKVTDIAANAFKGCKKIKKVEIGENVKKIGKKAFYGCKSLKNIIVNTTKLTSKNVGADAFKGINAKAVVTVPESKLKDYKKILKAKGLTGEKQEVKTAKVKYGEPDSKGRINYCDPKKEYFEEYDWAGEATGDTEGCWFRIMNDDERKASNKYSVGDTVKLRSVIHLDPPIYGWWEKDKRKITGRYVQCGRCGKYFGSNLTDVLHSTMQLSYDDGCWANCYLGKATANFQPETWIFVPDADPCSMKFQYILPEGISYKEGSLKVQSNDHDSSDFSTIEYASTDAYSVNVSGNILTLIVNNVKDTPFYKPYDYEACLKDITYERDQNGGLTEGSRLHTVVDLELVVNDNAALENEISSTVTYSYKGYDHSKSFDVSLHTAGLQISNTDPDGNSLSGATFDLYQTKTVYNDDNIGTSDWVLLKSGIHAGEVINGLGIGLGRLDKTFKIVQTSVPDGYEEAYPLEFDLAIEIKDGKTVVSAKAYDDDLFPYSLKVKDGIVQAEIVNQKNMKPSTNKSNSGDTGAATAQPKPDSGNSGGTTGGTYPSPAPATPTRTRVTAKATYYLDGVKDSTSTYDQEVAYGETMMESQWIYDLSSLFTGYTLQKIVLNGTEVSELPEMVPDGSKVDYYYVSQ